MKQFFGLLVLFCVFHSLDSYATPKFVENHGYVMGELNRVDLIGLNRKFVAGEVSIGNNSYRGGSEFRNEFRGDYVLHNPWTFCGDREFYEQVSGHIGEFAVIEYRTPKRSSLLQCQSSNEIIGIYPVSQGKPTRLVRESAKITMANKPYGVSVGRVVNAQKSDRYNNNWSIVVQVGNGGNDFHYLQIVDEDLYALALDCLISATKVKLYHLNHIARAHGVTDPDRNDSYVWRIEAKSGL